MKNIKSRYAVLLALAGLSLPALAAEHRIEMRNNGADGSMMTFHPAFLKVAKGDTVKFVAKDKSHNAAVRIAPKGATPFKGKTDEEIAVKLDTEGVYVYACDPHMPMGMVGVIQVGKPVNLDEVKKETDAINRSFIMNKDRLGKLLGQVK